MMGSLFSSISGLKNHTTWMNVVGTNISNVNTVGYKMSRITFKEAISQSLGSASGSSLADNMGGINPRQQGLGSVVGSIDTIMAQGAIQTTGNPTDVAIQGEGFFVVEAGNQTAYTRAGNFYFDDMGNLVSSSGALVQGWQRSFIAAPAIASAPVGLPMVDVTTGLNTNGPYRSIQIPQNLVLGPKMTGDRNTSTITETGIFLKGNLDSMTPQNPGFPGPQLGYPGAGYTPDAVNSATVYDSLGNRHVIVFYWTQVAVVPGAIPTWNWTAFDTGSDGQLPIPIAPAVGVPGTTALNVGNGDGVQFQSDGGLYDSGTWSNMTLGATIPQIRLQFAGPTVNGAYSDQMISVFMGTEAVAPGTAGMRDGLTGDFGGGTVDPTTGNYLPKNTIYTSFVDGYMEGTLTGVSIDSTGGINVSFSNNEIITMAKLALARFTNPAGLEKAGGTMFLQSANSGLPQVTTAGNAGMGTVAGGALEASNVDLSVELTNMIIAQRGFESNARIVSTSSDMLDTLVNLGR